MNKRTFTGAITPNDNSIEKLNSKSSWLLTCIPTAESQDSSAASTGAKLTRVQCVTGNEHSSEGRSTPACGERKFTAFNKSSIYGYRSIKSVAPLHQTHK
jgi:hypothetical protein